MKIESYSVNRPIKGVCKQYAIWGTEGGTTAPLVYLQRPKWITDDLEWEDIVDSIRLNLPKGIIISE